MIPQDILVSRGHTAAASGSRTLRGVATAQAGTRTRLWPWPPSTVTLLSEDVGCLLTSLHAFFCQGHVRAGEILHHLPVLLAGCTGNVPWAGRAQ